MTRWAVPALAGLAVLAAGMFAAGPAGLVVVAALLGVLGVLAAWNAGPSALARLPRKRRAVPSVSDAHFPSFRDIRGRVGWASSGRRHFDTSTRPLLFRLFAAQAMDRYRIDVHTDPDAARRLLGPDLWCLLDPGRPAATASGAPGVDLATLTRIVDRLEDM